jgi:cell division protein FtsB
MPHETTQDERQEGSKTAHGAQGEGRVPAPPLSVRILDWSLRVWRPAGTGVAVVLALMLGWHVVNGKHGLSVWQQKRVEDRQLRKEIETLEQENSRLRVRIEHLKSSPDAIEHEAREKLHYAKPGEVIYALPPDPPASAQPAGTGK